MCKIDNDIKVIQNLSSDDLSIVLWPILVQMVDSYNLDHENKRLGFH